MTRTAAHSLFAAVLLAVSATAAYAQGTISGPSFAITTPKGWKVQTFGGLKYKIAVGPVKNAFAPNINVVDEPFIGDSAAYAKANETALKSIPSFTKAAQTTLKTNSGLSAVRMVGLSNQQGKKMRQILYFIAGGKGTAYVITGTGLQSDGNKFDALFDATAKSFKLK